MKTLMVSPEELEEIKSGKKRYVLKRKCVTTKLALLCTHPHLYAAGVAEVVVHIGRPRKVYEATYERLGIDKMEFFNFFENRLRATVMEILDASWIQGTLKERDVRRFSEGVKAIKVVNGAWKESSIEAIIKEYFIDKNMPLCRAFQECIEKKDFYPECIKYTYM